MANFSAIMILFRFYIGIPILVIVFLSLAEGSTTPPKSKRQIYREQVLPSRGGKIPDAAFQTDRLALNRLNKEGISIPDGVLLEHRHVHSHPHINQHDPEDEDSVVQIIQKPEDRYVSPHGKYHYKRPVTVSSTYLIRKPIDSDEHRYRPSMEQFPIQETINQQQGNQIYQSYPESYLQKPREQYVPVNLSPSQKYVIDNTAFPEEVTIPSQTSIPLAARPSSQKYYPSEVSIPGNNYVQVQVPAPPPQKYYPAEVNIPSYDHIPKRVPPSEGYLSSGVQKYIPVGVSTSSQKYQHGNVRVPTTVIHHPNPYGYSPSVSYQQVQQSIAYYPINVPLVLPYKDTSKNHNQYGKGQRNYYGSNRGSENLHNSVNWPYLLGQYTRLAEKINAINPNSYSQSTPHSIFFTPEVFGPIKSDSRYYTTRERYARKSKEIAFTDSIPETNVKNRSKDTRRLIKLKCTSGSENTVEDGSPQCYIRY